MARKLCDINVMYGSCVIAVRHVVRATLQAFCVCVCVLQSVRSVYCTWSALDSARSYRMMRYKTIRNNYTRPTHIVGFASWLFVK